MVNRIYLADEKAALLKEKQTMLEGIIYSEKLAHNLITACRGLCLNYMKRLSKKIKNSLH